jgi:hypothetical protein
MKITTIRLNSHDLQQIHFLKTKLGIVSKTEIIRLALSKLANAELRKNEVEVQK